MMKMIPEVSDVIKFGGAALSWDGHNIFGDQKSIDLVKLYMHEAGTIPAFRERVAAAEARNKVLEARVRRLEGLLTGEDLEETEEKIFAAAKGAMNTRSVHILADELMQAKRAALREDR